MTDPAKPLIGQGGIHGDGIDCDRSVPEGVELTLPVESCDHASGHTSCHLIRQGAIVGCLRRPPACDVSRSQPRPRHLEHLEHRLPCALGTRRATLPAGWRGSVSVPLTRQARAILARHPRVRTTVIAASQKGAAARESVRAQTTLVPR